MAGFASLFISFVTVVLISGCATTPASSLQAQTHSAGDIRQQADALYMVPVPLYGTSGLSLGARQQSSGLLQLELCDGKQRAVNTDKPLVLYLDGELAYLDYQSPEAGANCLYYQVSEEELYRLSHCSRVILRVFFAEEVVEQRVSGTVSDYFSRARYYGPQERIKRFIDALPQAIAENQLIGG